MKVSTLPPSRVVLPASRAHRLEGQKKNTALASSKSGNRDDSPGRSSLKPGDCNGSGQTNLTALYLQRIDQLESRVRPTGSGAANRLPS